MPRTSKIGSASITGDESNIKGRLFRGKGLARAQGSGALSQRWGGREPACLFGAFRGGSLEEQESKTTNQGTRGNEVRTERNCDRRGKRREKATPVSEGLRIASRP